MRRGSEKRKKEGGKNVGEHGAWQRCEYRRSKITGDLFSEITFELPSKP
jgi:hypothetical protein